MEALALAASLPFHNKWRVHGNSLPTVPRAKCRQWKASNTSALHLESEAAALILSRDDGFQRELLDSAELAIWQ